MRVIFTLSFLHGLLFWVDTRLGRASGEASFGYASAFIEEREKWAICPRADALHPPADSIDIRGEMRVVRC